MSSSSKSYNATLWLVLFVVICVIGAKLAAVAGATNNWRGFGYSLLHVLIVALGAYFALRKVSRS